MRFETLYWLLDPETSGTGGRIFRCAHHTLLTAGIGIMVANTTPAWRQHWAAELDLGFRIVCVFFVSEYILRLAAAPGAPGSEHRGAWRSRLSWALSIGGRELLARQPELARIIHDEAERRLVG